MKNLFFVKKMILFKINLVAIDRTFQRALFAPGGLIVHIFDDSQFNFQNLRSAETFFLIFWKLKKGTIIGFGFFETRT